MDEPEKTFDTSSTDMLVKGIYSPLAFEEGFYRKDLIKLVTKKILNRISGLDDSISKWNKRGRFNYSGKNLQGQEISGKTSFSEVENILKKNRQYLHSEGGPPELLPTWMDSSLAVKLNFYFPENGSEKSLTIELNTKGSHNYPILPNIDREGIALSSTLSTLEQMLYSSRTDLVLHAAHMFSNENDYWLEKLITFLNTAVSLIENMLIMLYYKGKHDGQLFGWKFDEEVVGGTIYVRLVDKIKWIYQITGKHLPDITSEMNALTELKAVRNHLNHFDPPTFACTIEDVANWINKGFLISNLALKIRETTMSSISPNLIKLLLAPPVKYVPHDPGKVRYKQVDSGYRSCFKK
ncbi:hypothetical protein LEP1GSC058_0203 [Leptospira fainei serovar Hurstbridge str. BUT 6]|uniref:Uncharacterized protein n=1 Tax=Leptospira fainei serovar Hurstbridge str. BUT 6 TaxID=1193011 RepID=S3UPW2_9LEPT|nr:hypothetical protein [Leptospira fainei]EPG72441.1 hypothetical protein LEP1GSC058_0203 [Leptospira fainei serovar Hurstbridge str. BUT 6]